MRLAVDGGVIEEVLRSLHVIRLPGCAVDGPAKDAVHDGTVDAREGFAQDDAFIQMVDDHRVIGRVQGIVEIVLSMALGTRQELPIVRKTQTKATQGSGQVEINVSVMIFRVEVGNGGW